MRRPRRHALLVAVLPALLASGCAANGLTFRVDKRVKITQPKNRSSVQLPVTLRWTVRDFDVKTDPAGGGGSFGVFVDHTPVPPGKTLAWLARNDSECKLKPGCPDAAYLAERGVYETTDTSLVLSSVPGSDPTSTDKTSRHYATIVLLDGHGRRIGEIAFNVDFELKRKGS